MNSLDIIKQQLIRQRELLEERGFPVTVSNRNPAPTEITSAIENITMDFTVTTATEEDVKAGKTFFSQNNEIKTGTYDLSQLDLLEYKLKCIATGKGCMEIKIPSDATSIRRYAFHVDTTDDVGLFYAENLVIPKSVKTIQERAFFGCNITGPLTIPSTCTSVSLYAFYSTGISEVYIYNGLASGSTYLFCGCNKLKKAIIYQKDFSFPAYLFYNCINLEEITLPPSIKSSSFVNRNSISGCTSLKWIKFTGETPLPIASTYLGSHTTVMLLVPYLYYDSYLNGTNYQNYDNPIYGYSDFEKGDALPVSIEGYSIVWYASLDDLQTNTNPITSCPESGTMYAVFTSTEPEEATSTTT